MYLHVLVTETRMCLPGRIFPFFSVLFC